ARVRDLIVVLEIRHERLGRDAIRTRAAWLRLPGISLSLEQIASLGGRNQFLRASVVVAVVRLASSRERDDRAVMEVVVPDVVESVSALIQRTKEPDGLRLALGDEDYWLASRGR